VSFGPEHVTLAGRVRVVTGAALGLGAAIAGTFARFGAHVALCDRDAENLEATAQAARDSGVRVLTGQLDVRDTPAVSDFFSRIGEQFGHADVLVNNAGGGFQASFST
jgi:NADP-dependent 3-hydroxy acid dehydrogenase YdfG